MARPPCGTGVTGGKATGILGGVKLMAPLAVADLVDGVTFGALAVAAGLGHLAPIVLSASAFSGSAQYAALGVLRSHGALAAALLSAAALNVRYLAMGAAVTSVTTGSRWRRAARCLMLTDASWAMTSAATAESGDGGAMIGAGATSFVAWVSGTAIGVLVGRALGDANQLGLDAAFPALFVWLLVQQSGRDAAPGSGGSRARMLAAGLGAVIAAALVPLVPVGVPILVAGVAAAAWGAWR
jgi:4-azaleucine resistance transporter AzlC